MLFPVHTQNRLDGSKLGGVTIRNTGPMGAFTVDTDPCGNVVLKLGVPGEYDVVFSKAGFADESLTWHLGDAPEDPILVALSPGGAGPLPPRPTRTALIQPRLTFQGLLYPTTQFGMLPGFEACLPWLTPADRQVVYAAKHAAGDTHCIITIPDGVPLYDEPNQAYSPDKFGPLDWTSGNTRIGPELPALIREVIAAGFPQILLYLGGDGGGDAYTIAYTQVDLLHANEDFRENLYQFCVILPGWDGVFYGWPLEQVQPWSDKIRALWPDAVVGLHYSTGHIPLGEGGSDFQPGGRMANFDLLVGEFDDQVHQDSTWQILNRLEAHYVRPSDQPAGDDPDRVYYLAGSSPRGPWGHFAMEYGEYEAVRCGTNFAGMVTHVNQNRQYMRSMNVAWLG